MPQNRVNPIISGMVNALLRSNQTALYGAQQRRQQEASRQHQMQQFLISQGVPLDEVRGPDGNLDPLLASNAVLRIQQAGATSQGQKDRLDQAKFMSGLDTGEGATRPIQLAAFASYLPEGSPQRKQANRALEARGINTNPEKVAAMAGQTIQGPIREAPSLAAHLQNAPLSELIPGLQLDPQGNPTQPGLFSMSAPGATHPALAGRVERDLAASLAAEGKRAVPLPGGGFQEAPSRITQGEFEDKDTATFGASLQSGLGAAEAQARSGLGPFMEIPGVDTKALIELRDAHRSDPFVRGSNIVITNANKGIGAFNLLREGRVPAGTVGQILIVTINKTLDDMSAVRGEEFTNTVELAIGPIDRAKLSLERVLASFQAGGDPTRVMTPEAMEGFVTIMSFFRDRRVQELEELSAGTRQLMKATGADDALIDSLLTIPSSIQVGDPLQPGLPDFNPPALPNLNQTGDPQGQITPEEEAILERFKKGQGR